MILACHGFGWAKIRIQPSRLKIKSRILQNADKKGKDKEQGSITFEEETAAGLKSFAYNAR
jgi:hypothetical protein